MKQFIRAEDFDIAEDRMSLGGRLLDGSSILFAHIEKRVSLELLGYYAAIGVCAVIAFTNNLSGASAALLILAFILALGAYREIRRAYVLVMEIYQLGIFEVRGFTKKEASAVEQAVDELRRGSPGGPGRKTGFLSGSASW